MPRAYTALMTVGGRRREAIMNIARGREERPDLTGACIRRERFLFFFLEHAGCSLSRADS